MGGILRGVICAVALYAGCLQVAPAQEYRQLRADDFQGAPELHSLTIAYTHCTIDFKYQAHRKNGYYQLLFNIRLVIDHNMSWIDRSRIISPQMLSEVLKHEQGHYCIAYIEQQELLREVGRTRFEADYQYRAQQIFDRIDAKYKQLNLDYDQDTQHMTNRVQQASWDKYFRRKLDYMPRSDQG